MFESAEAAHRIDNETYQKRVATLRPRLLEAQYDLLAKKAFPVVVLINGVGGAGKGETVNLLNEWLDPRHIRNTAFGPSTKDTGGRPPMWRFWSALPARGRIGVLFGNWYTDPIEGRVHGGVTADQLPRVIDRVRHFEKLLTDDGALLVKLWFHLSKKAMRERLESLHRNKLTRWHVTDADWENLKRYDAYAKVSGRILSETSTTEAPWVVIEGEDANYRAIKAANTLLEAIRERLASMKPTFEARKQVQKTKAGRSVESKETDRILADLPFTERLSKERYETKIVRAQGQLATLSRARGMRKHAVVVVFEGMDAAGKGGAIRRVTQALDARQYAVAAIAAPTSEEQAHPYLWRFWQHLPNRGQFAIFDRSWYGRVLVERIEGFASHDAWSRAYGEINDFEGQLTEAGTIVVKIWLAITKDEQLRRFKEREATKFKQYKITPEDWRNRKKWEDYLVAGSEMIHRTSTSLAPWHVVEANDKHLARVRVIEALCARMKASF